MGKEEIFSTWLERMKRTINLGFGNLEIFNNLEGEAKFRGGPWK